MLTPTLQCKALTYVLGTKVAYPLDPEYGVTLKSYWSAQEQSVLPNCIVEPTSTKDVQAAIFVLSVVSKYKKFTSECKFAIKGAGHTPQKNAANQPGGVTIDLAALNSISVNPAKTVTSIGPGNRWGNVYSFLDPMNLAIPGGRVSEVGVAGLITGGKFRKISFNEGTILTSKGGISFFSARYGFVCDNVLNYEV